MKYRTANIRVTAQRRLLIQLIVAVAMFLIGLGFLMLPIGGLAQPKKAGSQPAPSPTIVGGPNGLFTNDENILTTSESFTIAYSSYHRDPGKIQATVNRRPRGLNNQSIQVPNSANREALLLRQPQLQLASLSPGNVGLGCSSNEFSMFAFLFDVFSPYEYAHLDDSPSFSHVYKMPLKFTFGTEEPKETSQTSLRSFKFEVTYRFGESPLSTDRSFPRLSSSLQFVGNDGMYDDFNPTRTSLTGDRGSQRIRFNFYPGLTFFNSGYSAPTTSQAEKNVDLKDNFTIRRRYSNSIDAITSFDYLIYSLDASRTDRSIPRLSSGLRFTGTDGIFDNFNPTQTSLTSDLHSRRARFNFEPGLIFHFHPSSPRAEEDVDLKDNFMIRGRYSSSTEAITSLGPLNSLGSSETLADATDYPLTGIFKPSAMFPCLSAIGREYSPVMFDGGGSRIETSDYSKAGDESYSSGEYRKALGHYLAALSSVDITRTERAQILMNVGVVYRALGESANALKYLKEALSASPNQRNPLLLYNIGLAHLDVGERSEALSCFNEALSLNTAETSVTGRTAPRGLVLNGLGSVHASLGEFTQALNYYNQALVTLKNSGDRVGEAILLTNLAKLHNSLGVYFQALNYLNEALLISESLSDRRGQANALYEMGNVYFNLNNMTEADKHYGRSLSLFTTIDDRLGQGLSLRGLGRVCSFNKSNDAIGYYERAKTIAEALGDQEIIALTLTDLGRLYKDSGNSNKALASYQRALELSRKLNDRTNEAVNLYEISLINRTLGRFDQSRISLEEAIGIVESSREQVPGFELRSTYSASIQKYYGLYIDVLVSLSQQLPLRGFDAKAFEASERGRGRTLLDSLGQAKTQTHTGVDPSPLERKPQMSVDRSISQTQPLSLREIREQVLDNNSVLLSYVLGSERSFLFTVTLDSLSVYILPKRSVIEPEVFNAYQLLASRAQDQTRGSEDLKLIDPEAAFEDKNQRLSDMLLGPLTKELSKKRFLIISDGALQIVSYAALYAPNGRTSHTATPLIVDHEIVNLPSASTLAMLRMQSASRIRPPKTVAVFADPIFSDSDPRISQDKQGTGSRSDTKYNFPRLPFSRWEADQIASLVPRSDVLLATGSSASLKTATSEELKQYRIVHFATHGTINEEHPELSSIVLSLFDKDGHPEDGFLRLSELYKMDLPVDLVVLSGCRTGLGKENPGEGLRSVTQGFMYAGASRVIFSLWAVDDRVTAELMVRFYRKMLINGLSPAESLRQVQIEMWKDSRWSSPYFWAPFVLQGEAN